MSKSRFKVLFSSIMVASGIMFTAPYSYAQSASGLSFGADAGIGYSRFTSSQTSNAAKQYVGAHGSAEVCGDATQSFALCGGVSGFSTFNRMTKTVAGTTIKTNMTSIGPYVKAKTKMGNASVAPYAGIARVTADHSITGLINSSTTEKSNVVYGGLEFEIPVFGEGSSIAFKAEAGRSVGTNLRTNMFSFKPSFKVKF